MSRGRATRTPAPTPVRTQASDHVRAHVHAAIEASPATRASVQALRNAGAEVWVVGGAVRDAHRGLEPKDVDLLARGLEPAALQRALKTTGMMVKLTGDHFGVFRVHASAGDECEIALPRTEVSTGPRYQDFDVRYDAHTPLEVDLRRRDFTVNALAMSLDGELVDIAGGLRDLDAGVLRLVRTEALEEDPLRTMRALSARARFGFVPDETTQAALAANAHRLSDLPKERTREEWLKFLRGPHAPDAIQLGLDTGIVRVLAPELAETPERLVEALRALDSTDPVLRTACLYGAARGIGSSVAADAQRFSREQLDLSSQASAHIAHLLREVERPLPTTDEQARRHLHTAGVDHSDDVLALRVALHPGEDVAAARALCAAVLERGEAVHPRHLTISGRDLLAAGASAGPAVGAGLAAAMEEVLTHPERNTPAHLLQVALAAMND